MESDHTIIKFLDQECIAFSNYLINQEPNSYVMDKYREAHRASETLRNLKPDPFDSLLLNLCRMSGVTAKLVDSYSSLFLRRSVVRKKMVVLLAILESCAPTYTIFDTTDPGGILTHLARMIAQGFMFCVSVVLAMVLLMPIHLMLAASDRAFSLTGRIVREVRQSANVLGSMETQPRDRASIGELPPHLPPG